MYWQNWFPLAYVLYKTRRKVFKSNVLYSRSNSVVEFAQWNIPIAIYTIFILFKNYVRYLLAIFYNSTKPIRAPYTSKRYTDAKSEILTTGQGLS